MYRIVLNGAAVSSQAPCKTWGQLLEWLDARCGEQGLLVTEVRLDGVEWPAFRDPASASQSLEDAAIVDIDAVPPGELLASTLDQAIDAALGLEEAAERIGTALRGIEIHQANCELAEFAETLRTLATIANTVAGALGITLEQVSVDGRAGARLVEELAGYAETVIAAQAQQDWITVADSIEYDVAPALAQWPTLFVALRDLVVRPPAAQA